MSACNNDSNLNSRPDSCSENSYGMSAPRYHPPLNKGVYGSTLSRYRRFQPAETNHLDDLSADTPVPDYFNWLDENSRKSVGLDANLSSHFDYAINQGECGCCWAVATATSLGHRYAIQLAKNKYKINSSLILSALELLSANVCGTKDTESIIQYAKDKLKTELAIPESSNDPNAHCIGGNLQLASEWLTQNRITLNKCWRYHTPFGSNTIGWDENNQSTNFESLVGVSGCSTCKNAKIAQIKVGVKGNPQSNIYSIDKIKADIYENGPVATSMAPPNNFQEQWFSQNEDDIITVSGNGNPANGHSVVIVGWGSDNGGYWIVQNSWGKPDNRPNGTFKINFDNGIGVGAPRCEDDCEQPGGVVSFLPTDASSDDIKLLIAAQLISTTSGTTPNIKPNIKPTIVTPSPPPPPPPTPPPTPPPPPPAKQKEKHDYTGLILVLLLLAGMGIIGYTIYKKRHKGKRRRKRK
jgi:hypothetical protein